MYSWSRDNCSAWWLDASIGGPRRKYKPNRKLDASIAKNTPTFTGPGLWDLHTSQESILACIIQLQKECVYVLRNLPSDLTNRYTPSVSDPSARRSGLGFLKYLATEALWTGPLSHLFSFANPYRWTRFHENSKHYIHPDSLQCLRSERPCRESGITLKFVQGQLSAVPNVDRICIPQVINSLLEFAVSSLRSLLYSNRHISSFYSTD